jgi:hypothetical protein
MAAPTVFEDVPEDFALEGQLFAGKKFWVAQRVPIRNALVDDIKANGGEVVLLEKKADYMIADHIRRDCPPGSTSYTFIQESIDKGELQDPEDHIAGPPLGEAREVGALHRPARGGRAAYTADEDRILYKWVRDCAAVGGLAGGNEIYKQLEAKVCARRTVDTRTYGLMQDSIRDTHGNHGATVTSSSCATALPLPLTYPTMPRHLHLQTPQLNEQRNGKNKPQGRSVGET